MNVSETIVMVIRFQDRNMIIKEAKMPLFGKER